jgi:hypothetical protein
MAIAGCAQQRRTQAEGSVLQRGQIDTSDENVPAEQGGINREAAEIVGYGSEVFSLNQSDLTVSALAVVTDEAGSDVEIGGQYRAKGLSAGRTNANPRYFAGPDRRGQQASEGGFGI